jgi:methionyl-tRNA formyltransferase
MRILILSNSDLASNIALNSLLPTLSTNHDVHLWLSAKVGKAGARPRQLESLKFFEQDLFNQLFSPLLNESKNTERYKSFEGLNVFLQSTVREENKINSPEAIGRLHELSPDLIVSIRFGGILRTEAISIPKLGVINLHSGKLPKYKGVMATFWALKNGESEIGTTLHTIDDPSIDTGKIIKISTYKVDKSKSYLWHVLALYTQGTLDVLEAINSLKEGREIKAIPQKTSETYFTFPNQEECDEFEAEGFKFMDEREYIDLIQVHYL